MTRQRPRTSPRFVASRGNVQTARFTTFFGNRHRPPCALGAEEIRSFAEATKSSVSDLVQMAWAYASREPGFQDLIAVAVKVAQKK
jgi:hypothetical protein